MTRYDVAVIGGGAIGVSAAYYLALRGKKVVLLEKDQIGLGCSYGNAGLVVPGFTVPLATPRALSQGLRWLLRGAGPFTIHSSARCIADEVAATLPGRLPPHEGQ